MRSVFIIQRILHECLCIIEFIKRAGEKDKMRGGAERFISFLHEFNNDHNFYPTLSSYFLYKKGIIICTSHM